MATTGTASLPQSTYFKILEEGLNSRDWAGHVHSAAYLTCSYLLRLPLQETTRQFVGVVKNVVGGIGGALAVPGTLAQICAVGKEWAFWSEGKGKLERVFKEVALTAEMWGEAAQFYYGLLPENSLALAGKIVQAQVVGSLATLAARTHDVYLAVYGDHNAKGECIKGKELQSKIPEIKWLGQLKVTKAFVSATLAIMTLARVYFVANPVVLPWILSSTLLGLGLSVTWLSLEIGTSIYASMLKEKKILVYADL